MRWKLVTILALLVLLSVSPARAGLLGVSSELKQALSAPEVVVNDITLNKADLNAFYQSRDYRFAWDHRHGGLSPALTAFLDSAESVITWHGLARDDYMLDVLRQMTQSPNEGDDVNIELLTTNILLQLSYDLHGESYDLTDLYPGWNYRRHHVDIPALLSEAVANNKLDRFINDIAPQHPVYEKLAQTLQKYRAVAAKGGWPTIDAGPPLRFHDHGRRVGQLRARLAAEDYLPAPVEDEAPTNKKKKKHAPAFDEELEEALKEYQRCNGLEPVGFTGKMTLAALNTPIAVRIDQIRANMERWRHIPEDFPAPRHALVNIASMTIDITDSEAKSIYNGNVIIGRVDRKTPFIQSAVRSMIVNPSWHVPLKIARADILPKLRKDPHYLEKMGFVISGSTDDPHGTDVDWKKLSDQEFNFRLRQSPGDLNSLGHLKFDFDNDFAVYMHDTPHQELFEKYERDLSSGCIRLHDPEQVGEIVTADNKEPWSAQKITEAITEGKTRWVGVTKPLPIYVLYWTVFFDADGKLNFRKDIYDYDTFLIDVMDQRGAEAPDQPTPPPAAQALDKK